MMSLVTGTKLGRYEIRSQLGAGGMGEVYLAQDTKLDRKVALKILPAEIAADRRRMSRFVQEAKAASALNHPNILTIYEIDQANSVPFIATEFIDGETLRQRMKSSPLKLGDVLSVTAQIASALSAAHAAGIVHRDIKPENIMLRRDGIAKVLDFGLAKLTDRPPPDSVDAEAPTTFKTDPGTVVGTRVYMSPEQARGIPVDARTDIFSLGVVLYEMVAGCLPFAGSTSSEVVASLLSEKEPQPLARYSRDVPAELERIVCKALRKEREQRYQSVKDLVLDLQSLKQQLEFEAKLERSMSPESKGAMAATTGPEIVEESTRPSAHSTSRMGLLTGVLMLHRRSVIPAAAVVLILLAVPLGYFLLSRNGLTTAQPEIKSLAVLPLENLSGDPAQDYFADGMTEELIASLSKIGSLRVISRTSVMQYKGARKPLLKEIARELNVDAVVEGSVLRSGDRVRISVQLIYGATDRHLWAESYQRDLRDVLALQSEVGQAIANEIRIKLTPQEQGLFGNAGSVNPKALEEYLQGRDYFNQGRNKGGAAGQELLKTSIGHFEQATRIQPDYALAYAGAARANHWLAGSGAPPEFFTKSKDAALRALQIDERLAEAHGALAYVLMTFDRDWAGSEKEFKRAIELTPSYSEARHGYALYLSAMGRHDEAIREINIAAELDPLTSPLKRNMGGIYISARQYDRAIEHFRRLRDAEPNNPEMRSILGRAYVLRGMYDEGIAELRKASDLSGVKASRNAVLAWAYAVSGNRSEAIKILEERLKTILDGTPVSKVNIASAYAALGNKDQAFAWLEKAQEERSPQVTFVNVDPAFDSLRSDARFADLLRRVGLPQ
jgi:eukaryotic-like serine/threonine-protein kinase